ncbi:MAG: 1,4-alpha-glucan branching protein GlgB [Lachnospiraceae bacterium]|nr:1,4-alpha-glucan branching protein GlgB [Lachnospiraceae bacterium]
MNISEMDSYLFGTGTHYEIYKKLGAHITKENGVMGTYFAVWAPNAAGVSVVGDFNGWNEYAHGMHRISDVGIWAMFVPGVKEGALYKFLIITSDGRRLYKADPFANYAQVRPETASVVTDLTGFKWEDSSWINARKKAHPTQKPLAIYECHVGSFMRHPKEEPLCFYNYREFADRLIEYLKDMKYTHVELMGIAEHPFDGSWGYQVTGYYAPTSRYGTPKDFMYLVNELHKAGVGVILDWVPAHFARDAHGLGEFDGTCIYEHPDPRRGEHPDWGTKIFNYGKSEVKNFLIANVFYWMREYHIDGIRVDAVASMLYLDYGKKPGEWLPNKDGGNENYEAIEFFKHLNSVVHKECPGFLTIAEESTAWPRITAPCEDGGLGFTFKWNMGWMHDFCEYIKLNPYFRKDDHYAMTFAMSYNESENYILPLSHDEIVHLKCSMVNKMPGYEVDKYANLRAAYAYMFGHAGKKLLFMGQDFGQEREWSEERELDWFMLERPLNSGLKLFVSKLLEIYNKYPCMYELDNSWSGFEWMNADDRDRSTYSFVRKPIKGKDKLLFVVNMTPMKWENYIVPVLEDKTYTLLLNSDEERFGGFGNTVDSEIKATNEECNKKPYSISLDLPPYGALIFKF